MRVLVDESVLASEEISLGSGRARDSRNHALNDDLLAALERHAVMRLSEGAQENELS